MALMKGGNTAPEQMQDTAYTPEQQREIKLGMIMLKARRVWRIFCLVMCGIGLLFSVFNTIAYGQSFIGGILSVIMFSSICLRGERFNSFFLCVTLWEGIKTRAYNAVRAAYPRG